MDSSTNFARNALLSPTQQFQFQTIHKRLQQQQLTKDLQQNAATSAMIQEESKRSASPPRRFTFHSNTIGPSKYKQEQMQLAMKLDSTVTNPAHFLPNILVSPSSLNSKRKSLPRKSTASPNHHRNSSAQNVSVETNNSDAFHFTDTSGTNIQITDVIATPVASSSISIYPTSTTTPASSTHTHNSTSARRARFADELDPSSVRPRSGNQLAAGAFNSPPTLIVTPTAEASNSFSPFSPLPAADTSAANANDHASGDFFSSFAPTVSSRPPSATVLNASSSIIPTQSSPNISYVAWKLPSSFAPQPHAVAAISNSPRKKGNRNTKNSELLPASSSSSSEYVLGVLDELDPPLHTLSIYLDSWLERYIDEPQAFDSLQVFISVKYQELKQLLRRLARPNSFRTWLCADLLLKFITTLPGTETLQGGTAARNLATILFYEILEGVYTKVPAKNFGLVPFQLHARTTLLHVHDRELHRNEALMRVREFHLHRCGILYKWQPCIRRTIRAWQIPYMAVFFMRWRRYRQMRLARGVSRSGMPDQQFDDITFISNLMKFRRTKMKQNEAAVALLGWKILVGHKQLGISLKAYSEICAMIATTQKHLSKSQTIQSEREEKLRATIRELWLLQHEVMELQCRIQEERETHAVHAGQKSCTLILTQWYRYLYLHITSNHQRSFEAHFLMNNQDTSSLMSNVQSNRMRHLFDAFKGQAGDSEAFSSIRQFLKRRAASSASLPSAAALLKDENGDDSDIIEPMGGVLSKRSSLRSVSGMEDDGSSPGASPPSVTTTLGRRSMNNSSSLLPSASLGSSSSLSMSNRRRSGFNGAMFDTSNGSTMRFRNGPSSQFDTTPFAISEESTPLMSPNMPPKGLEVEAPPMESLDELSGVTALRVDVTVPEVDSNATTPAASVQSTPSRNKRLLSSPSDIPLTETATATTEDADSGSDRRQHRNNLFLNDRRRDTTTPHAGSTPQPGGGTPTGEWSWNSSASTTPAHSRTPSTLGGTTNKLPPVDNAPLVPMSPARKRWQAALIAVLMANRAAIQEREDARVATSAVTGAIKLKDKDTIVLSAWMKSQVNSWKESLPLAMAQKLNNKFPISQQLAEQFLQFLVNQTMMSTNCHTAPLDWSNLLSYATTPAQKALPPTDPSRLMPSQTPPHPAASIPHMLPSLTSNLNLLTHCPVALPFLALSPTEIHQVKVGIAQVLGMGYVTESGAPLPPPSSASSTSSGSSNSNAKDESASTAAGVQTESEQSAFYAVWLRLFSVMTSLPCDFDGDNLDFDTFFLQLAEAEGIARAMLQNSNGYVNRSGQLESYLLGIRNLRFALKKKRVEGARAHNLFMKQKRHLQSAIAAKLNAVIRDNEREGRVALARNVSGYTGDRPDSQNSSQSGSSGNSHSESTSDSRISSAMISRRASISMSLGTGLLPPTHPAMSASSTLGTLASPPMMQSQVGSTGMSSTNSVVQSTRHSRKGSTSFNAVDLEDLRADRSDTASNADATETPLSPDELLPSPVGGDSVTADQSAADAAEAKTKEGDAATAANDETKELAEDDEEEKDASSSASSRRSSISSSSSSSSSSSESDSEGAGEEDDEVSKLESSVAVADDPDINPLDPDANPEAIVQDSIVGVGEMEGLDDLPKMDFEKFEGDSSRIPKAIASAPTYRVEIVHSVLVQTVNHESAIRQAAAQQAQAAKGAKIDAVDKKKAADWSMVTNLVEIRRCEVLLATHLSQLRKWYRTCLGEETATKVTKGKLKGKNAAAPSAGTDTLLVTRDRLLKLLQRAKLLNSKAFGTAQVVALWGEIAAWKSEAPKDKEASATPATPVVHANATAMDFDAAVALFCKISALRFRPRSYALPSVSERLNAFLQLVFPLQILPYTSMNSKFYPLQAAMANANTQTAVGSAANRLERRGSTNRSNGPAPPPMAYLGPLSSFEGDENEEQLVKRLCDEVFKINHKWLYYLFTFYGKEKETGAPGSPAGSMEPAMSRENFMEFINESTLLSKKVIYLRTINSLWVAQETNQAAAAAAEAVVNPAAKASNTSGTSLMTYKYFLDAMRVLCVFLHRDPMMPLPSKLERLVAFLWNCPGFERVKVSMGVSSAVQNSVANSQAVVQQQKELQAQQQQQAAAASSSSAQPQQPPTQQ